MKILYSFNPVTFLYSGHAEYTPVRPTLYVKASAISLPANTTLVAPPEIKTREFARWDPESESWEVVADFRGVHLYSTANGSYAPITEIGITPEQTDAVEMPRPDPSYAWDATAGEWRIDADRRRTFAAVAVRQDRDNRLMQADRMISKAMDNGDDAADLRTYRQLLRDVPDQPGFPDNVEWPEAPVPKGSQ